MHAGKAAGTQPLGQFFRRGVGGQFHGKGEHQPRVIRPLCTPQHLRINRFGRVVLHRQCGLAIEQVSGARKQQLEVVIELGHGAHGGAAGAHRVGLVDGDGRGHALHLVHSGLVHTIQKLARVGRKGLHVAALALGVQGVKHQAGLARAAGPSDHGQLAGADVQIKVLEVVLSRSADADGALGHGAALSNEDRHSRS